MLFVLLLLAHYLADFTHLSMPYMLRAKAIGYPWFPIFQHATIHALLMCVLVWWSAGISMAVVAYGIILTTHFAIDVLKGKLNVWFPKLKNPSNPFHWYIFGADQMLHILVIFLVYNISI